MSIPSQSLPAQFFSSVKALRSVSQAQVVFFCSLLLRLSVCCFLVWKTYFEGFWWGMMRRLTIINQRQSKRFDIKHRRFHKNHVSSVIYIYIWWVCWCFLFSHHGLSKFSGCGWESHAVSKAGVKLLGCCSSWVFFFLDVPGFIYYIYICNILI